MDSDCQKGQCFRCNPETRKCEPGTTYNDTEYDTHAACICAREGRVYAQVENRCCATDKYDSAGHCCPTSQSWCTYTSSCRAAGECHECGDNGQGPTGGPSQVCCAKADGHWTGSLCCSAANDGTDMTGKITSGCCTAAGGRLGGGTCCAATKDGTDLSGVPTRACCESVRGTWADNTCTLPIQCNTGYDWDESAAAKESSSGNAAGACCPHSNWVDDGQGGGECCSNLDYLNYWTGKRTPVCAERRCTKNSRHWDTSAEAKARKDWTSAGACCTEKWVDDSVNGSMCCSGDVNNWSRAQTKTCCIDNGNNWDTSVNKCCPHNNWVDDGQGGGECCSNLDYLNYWTGKRTPVCAERRCTKNSRHWDTSAEAKARKDWTSAGACCTEKWVDDSVNGSMCCSGDVNNWSRAQTKTCCIDNGKTWTCSSDGRCKCQ